MSLRRRQNGGVEKKGTFGKQQTTRERLEGWGGGGGGTVKTRVRIIAKALTAGLEGGRGEFKERKSAPQVTAAQKNESR